jgi:hypothetical protein
MQKKKNAITGKHLCAMHAHGCANVIAQKTHSRIMLRGKQTWDSHNTLRSWDTYRSTLARGSDDACTQREKSLIHIFSRENNL